MSRRLPVIPTMVVAIAVALMIGLGIWQLQRAKLHAAELAAYRNAASLPPITFPTVPLRDDQLPLYRYATGNCSRIVVRRTSTGEDRSGEPGFVIILDCATGAEGPGMSIEVGWSKNPNATTSWSGGLISGMIVPDRKSRIRLVSATPAPGLQATAQPTPAVKVSAARNRGYAITWFGLALAALTIYALAVRKRLLARTIRP